MMEWWPDWIGETAVLCASGPSLTTEDIYKARDRARVVTINRAWELAPWADMAYGCDWRWWAHRGPTAKQFPGLRVIGKLPSEGEKVALLTEAHHAHLAGLLRVEIMNGTGPMIWAGPQIRGGGNSAFQAVNLLARWGVSRIILLGIDCDAPNSHFHGSHDHTGAPRQDDSTIKTWIHQWNIAAPDLMARGVEVINCSPISRVECFRRATISDVLSA